MIAPLWSGQWPDRRRRASPVVLAVVICAYVILIGIAAVVGTLHPDEKIRADAQKVLERLVGHGRRTNR